jgi:hypothetical protein
LSNIEKKKKKTNKQTTIISILVCEEKERLPQLSQNAYQLLFEAFKLVPFVTVMEDRIRSEKKDFLWWFSSLEFSFFFDRLHVSVVSLDLKPSKTFEAFNYNEPTVYPLLHS